MPAGSGLFIFSSVIFSDPSICSAACVSPAGAGLASGSTLSVFCAVGTAVTVWAISASFAGCATFPPAGPRIRTKARTAAAATPAIFSTGKRKRFF